MLINSKYKYFEEYILEIQSKGRYSLTLDELKTRFDISEKAILQKIFRLKNKNQLAQVRQEFYVIIPPQYSIRGMVPPTLFIDDMMEFLNKEYYVGLLSAAALHGAGHQQPMEFQVITKKPALRSIRNQKLVISFFIKGKWEQIQINEKKTETGYIKVSSPALTAFDLVYYNKKIGGLNRIIPILEDLAESINSYEIRKATKFQKIPTIQRLGYLFEVIGAKKLADSLFKTINQQSLKKTPLSLLYKENKGWVNDKWNVIVNTELDF